MADIIQFRSAKLTRPIPPRLADQGDNTAVTVSPFSELWSVEIIEFEGLDHRFAKTLKRIATFGRFIDACMEANRQCAKRNLPIYRP